MKISNGYSGNIEGWLNAGATYAGSGVDYAGNNGIVVHSGTMTAFCKGSDSGAYQIANYQIQDGDQVSLTWWAKSSYNNAGQQVELLKAPSLSSSFSALLPLAASTAALNNTGNGGAYTQYTLVYTASAADAGSFPAVFFNASGGSSFAMFDDFALRVNNAPMTPPSLAAVAGNGQVTLSWGTVFNAASYTMARGTSSGGPYPFTVYGLTSGTYTDNSVTNETTYYYVMTAANSLGTSATSAPVMAKPYTPLAPSELVSPPIAVSGEGAQFNFQSVYGRVYQLQYTNSLTPSNWTNLGSPVTGTGATIILSDPGAGTVPARFYRLFIQP
jgi:hypothetical protein